MKSIICGAGEVGKSIAEKLSKVGFEVTVAAKAIPLILIKVKSFES